MIWKISFIGIGWEEIGIVVVCVGKKKRYLEELVYDKVNINYYCYGVFKRWFRL